MKLKICGMKYTQNITEVSQLLPDYLGFIFWEKSSRYFDGILPALPQSIQKVGVFVNATLQDILSKIEKYGLNAIQLHGNESETFCFELKSHIPISIQIIKVFSIGENFNFKSLKPYEKACDYYLFDTKGKLPGGNGTTFNWELLQKYNSQKPFFLSGGIGMPEIGELEKLKTLNLPIYAIDVNSKFEIEPGLKNKIVLTSFKNHLQTLNLK